MKMIITLEWNELLTSNHYQVVSQVDTLNLEPCFNMSQGDTDKNVNFQYKNGCKGHHR